jgi:hypothetical protein
MQNCNDPLSTNASAEVGMCTNSPILTPANVPPRTQLVKIPVVLAELNINANLVANITFPDPVLEIKDIKKRLKIVQSRLVQGFATNGTEVFTLFLRGFVRKNIQYATPCPSATNQNAVSSEMRSFTVDVPFECSTDIPATSFLTIPLFPDINRRDEFDFFRAQNLGPGFPEKDQLLSSDLSQFHQRSSQFLNEIVYTELLASNITEWDEAVDRQPLPNGPFEEGYFTRIVEKMVVSFAIKLLQNQQIFVPFPPRTGPAAGES